MPHPSIVFTAFEPSGDDHASAVIRELRRRHADLPIYAWGGPKMEQAGAILVHRTGDDAVVGFPGWKDIKRHLRMRREIDLWLRGSKPTVHVPVDSPGANFAIAKAAKRQGCRVVHLVAPQLWAWGPWRINKLRRRTDHVMCLLPFEEAWFKVRGVPATFVGHPLFDEQLDTAALDAEGESLPRGEVRLAVLPGSRAAELRRNFPVMLAAFRELSAGHPGLVGVVAATTERVADQLQQRARDLGGWPANLDIVVAATDRVVRWCTAAVAVSGTVSLQIARQRKPMVIMYKTNELAWNWLGRHLITTRFISLPNLIAGREAVTELFPYFKGHERLTRAVDALISDPEAQDAQRRAIEEVCGRFAGRVASSGAADVIERIAGMHSVAAVRPRG
ncbi:MAG: hypothetical protein JNK58_04555 [Phycisphaerae bacterium]|nr:hypothetical protein [Phycisphaerae bacterium]